MTDQDRPDERDLGEPAVDGTDETWVRGLLADARVTGPVPDDVATRLDETLASLRAERFGAGDPEADPDADSAAVVPLRRRLAPWLAAAAAFVVVAGGAVGVTRLGQDRSTSSQSAAGGVSADTGSSSRAPADRESSGATVALPRLARATFARDAAAVMHALAVDTAGTTPGTKPGSTPGTTEEPQADAAEKGAAPPVTTTPVPEALLASIAGCPGPRVVGAVSVPAVLDGTPVALVFRPPTADARRVEAWSCDGATLLAAATVAR